MTSVASPEEVCNLALDRIKYPESIGDLYEGTRASRAALRAYAQTRDDVLRGFTWGFARRDVLLTLLKTAPVGGYGLTPWTNAFPMPPWIYEYAYPTDCLLLRTVRETPLLIPSFDPKPNLFNVANDNSLAPPAKVILTNVAGAIGVYTGQVTDMTTWEPSFVEAMVEALGRRLAQALADDPETVKVNAEEEQGAAQQAAAKRG